MARIPKTRAPGRGGDADATQPLARTRAERATKRAEHPAKRAERAVKPAERTAKRGEPRPGAAAHAPAAAEAKRPPGDRARSNAPGRPAKGAGSGRQEARVTINKEFESFDAFVSEYVSNLSRSGVFVRTRKPLPVGTKVDLRFTVLMDDVEIVEGVGEVVRVHEDPAGMGLVFTELSGYSEAIIERLLTAQSLAAPRGR